MDVSNCGALQVFVCNDNLLTNLDLTNCTELAYLKCDSSVTVIGYEQQ